MRAEPLLRVEDVKIDLMKGIGSVGECINVKLKLFSALEEVGFCTNPRFLIEVKKQQKGSVQHE